MRRPAMILLLFLGSLLGIHLLTAEDGGGPEKQEKQEEQPADYKPGLVYKGRWGHVDLPSGFRLSLPEGWEFDRARGYGYLFRRKEKVDGFYPNVHLYWYRDPTPFDDWVSTQRSKRQGGGTKILNEGDEPTMGRRGYFLIYETKSKQPGGALFTVTKDWLFSGPGAYKGILRGISTARTFLDPYHATFNEVHARLKKS